MARHGLVVLTRAGTDPGRFVHESDTLWRHAVRPCVMLALLSGAEQHQSGDGVDPQRSEFNRNQVRPAVACGVWHAGRRAVSRGQSIKYLVPVPVSEYIDANGLYRAD